MHFLFPLDSVLEVWQYFIMWWLQGYVVTLVEIEPYDKIIFRNIDYNIKIVVKGSLSVQESETF